MDSLTQIVLGAAVGEAVAGRNMGIKAALWGAVGGTIPDLDVFLTVFRHPFDGALVHRGFSHSLVFGLLAGPMLGWVFHRLYKRRFDRRSWTLLWTLAIVTHPMLDIFTNYGTQFLWPLDLRISFNTVFVIDPLYTLPFMTCLLVALFLKRTDPRRRKWNRAGILWSCGYLLWGVIVKLVLLAQAPAWFGQAGAKVSRTMVTPAPLTSFYWQMVGETDSSYCVAYRSLFSEFDPGNVQVIPKNHALLERLRWKGKNRAAQLRHITGGYYALEQRNDTVRCYDLRFGTLTELTDGKVTQPLMGFGMLVDKGVVQKSFRLERAGAFEDVNFGAYIDKVFGK